MPRHLCFLCRRTSAATTHAVLSDEEEEDLLSGDSLWEDEQASKVSMHPSTCTVLVLVLQRQHIIMSVYAGLGTVNILSILLAGTM